MHLTPHFLLSTSTWLYIPLLTKKLFSISTTQGFSQNKIEGGGGKIGLIETAENADTCVAIIARYILHVGMCTRAQYTASVECV